MKLYSYFTSFIMLICAMVFLACSSTQDETTLGPNYAINGPNITNNGQVLRLNGVNALNSFGISNHELFQDWNITIVREFIGNLREQPIDGSAIQASNGSHLHPLQNVVNANRAKGAITILCPFGWVDEQGISYMFTGLNPTDQVFYSQYKQKMRAIAEHFKNQPDVWLEVWNEPYHFNNENGYTHELWMDDQIDMVDNLRSVNGFNNIIVVPGNEQGQSEAAIAEKGNMLLQGRTNILFDIHAYEKWLLNTPESGIEQRINHLYSFGFAFIFGEVGVINASGLMPVSPFLSAVTKTQTTTLAWVFNRNTNDQNALLTDEGTANNTNNNNWGTTYKAFLNSSE
jgi:mannan endo-1,4-beta-mannosidase